MERAITPYVKLSFPPGPDGLISCGVCPGRQTLHKRARCHGAWGSVWCHVEVAAEPTGVYCCSSDNVAVYQ